MDVENHAPTRAILTPIPVSHSGEGRIVETSTDAWAPLIHFDEWLIDEDGWSQRPVLELVSWLSAGLDRQVLASAKKQLE